MRRLNGDEGFGVKETNQLNDGGVARQIFLSVRFRAAVPLQPFKTQTVFSHVSEVTNG